MTNGRSSTAADRLRCNENRRASHARFGITPAPKVVTKTSKPKAPGQGLKRATARVKPKAHPAVTAPIPYVSPFSIGDHISHPQFGEGTVTEIDDAKLTIDFASRGTKQIIDYYVKRSKEG